MYYLKTISFLLVYGIAGVSINKNIDSEQKSNYLEASRELLRTIKDGRDYNQPLEEIKNLDFSKLKKDLKDDDYKKAFWINIYNAYIQILLNKQPELYEDKDSFFKDELVTIGNKQLSFDDIEHGIIRGSQFKYGLGYIPNIFAGSFEKAHRLSTIDPRIHFGLNCGAKSCPPVFIYSGQHFDDEIDKIATKYLSSVSKYDEESDVLTTTPLIQWFRGDFGSKKDLLNMFYKYEVIPEGANPSIKYADYDWSIDLNNFVI
ncbi:MAG TPA: DUF547 domain-containing protein [Cyclobacteriaceae bacterium]